jgi:glutathione S-transferase
LAVLECTQFPDFGQNQAPKFEAGVQWLHGQLAKHDWVAGDVFSIADITAFCALEFARLAKFKAADKGFSNVARWHAAMSQRASAPAGNA